MELKILVADKISAYHQYVDAHSKLFTANDPESFFLHARVTVESYLANRLIIAELDHYKRKGEILGRHPIFHWMSRLGQIRSMKVGDLVNLKIRLENNLIRTRKKIRSQKDHPLTASRLTRLEQIEKELQEVNRLLNL